LYRAKDCAQEKNVLRYCHETNLSAKEAQARANARLFEAFALQERPQPAHAPSPQGSRSPFGLSAMPKKYRLSGNEIRNLSGKRIHGRFFSLLIAPIAGSHAKCATVVSKKVAAKAVDRNKIKRRIRNALAKRVPDLHKVLGLVFSAKRDAKGASAAELERDIDVLFSNLQPR
jgi:ribonuclease P protein component